MAVDWSMGNEDAARMALRHGGDAYKNISRAQKKAIRSGVAKYFREAMTLGDLINELSGHFNEEQAEVIAVTEVTRMAALAEQATAEELKKELPGTQVFKIWETRKDSEVCPVCRALQDVRVEINQSFAKDIFLPPAHDGCRCAISVAFDW